MMLCAGMAFVRTVDKVNVFVQCRVGRVLNSARITTSVRLNNIYRLRKDSNEKDTTSHEVYWEQVAFCRTYLFSVPC